MSVSSGFLVKILQLELKEVENDLNGLKDLYSSRHNNSDITNYVFLENTALLQSELQSIHRIGTQLKMMEIDPKLSPKEILDSIDQFIKKEVEKKHYSVAIYNYIKLKLEKVSKYLDM
jgi:ATP-dependent protease Clp ATPase subunit